ncbi:MAG: hypothetical protein HY661_09220 [Betaproteobacteria bacterium]|nr:hypothetical protein [Betaproteobacteria bacterium]
MAPMVSALIELRLAKTGRAGTKEAGFAVYQSPLFLQLLATARKGGDEFRNQVFSQLASKSKARQN